MPASESLGGRLFRHDWRIAANTVRAALAPWHDRLIALIMLLAALAVLRSWLADQPPGIATLAALGAGMILGIGTGRSVALRLGFHSYDGLLAADALHPPTRRRYVVACHGIGIAALAAVTLIAQPPLLMFASSAYLAGALLAHTIARLLVPEAASSGAMRRWPIGRWLHHPGAGIAAATILLLSLWPAHKLGTGAPMAIAGIEAVMFALMLTIVDHKVVRFMTAAGHGSWPIIARHAQPLLAFAGITVPACWLLAGPPAAGLVAAASALMLLLLAVRVLAYRIHGKRFADLLVSLLAGLLMLAAYSMPILLPFLLIPILRHLHRRAAAGTWLLA